MATLKQVQSGLWSIAWEKVSSAVEYRIYVNGTKVRVVKDPQVTYIPSHKLGITADGSYVIGVTAYNGAGESLPTEFTLDVDSGAVPASPAQIGIRLTKSA